MSSRSHRFCTLLSGTSPRLGPGRGRQLGHKFGSPPMGRPPLHPINPMGLPCIHSPPIYPLQFYGLHPICIWDVGVRVTPGVTPVMLSPWKSTCSSGCAQVMAVHGGNTAEIYPGAPIPLSCPLPPATFCRISFGRVSVADGGAARRPVVLLHFSHCLGFYNNKFPTAVYAVTLRVFMSHHYASSLPSRHLFISLYKF